jgi:hypothetical protein
MSAAAAGDDADLRGPVLAEDDLVCDVALDGGVRVRDANEGGMDEVCWVMDEVFR